MTRRQSRIAAFLLLIVSLLAVPRPADAGANTWIGNGPTGQSWVVCVAYVDGTTPAILASFNSATSIAGIPTWVARSTDNGVTWTAGTMVPCGTECRTLNSG